MTNTTLAYTPHSLKSMWNYLHIMTVNIM